MKGMSEGNVLPLSVNEHCLANEELKVSFFSLKSVINLISRKSGRFFLPFKNFFNRVQEHLELKDGFSYSIKL